MKNEMRAPEIFVTVAWGVIGAIMLLQTGNSLYSGETPDVWILGGLGLSIVTVIGTLMGNNARRVVGKIWFIIAAIGIMLFIGGVGMTNGWMVEKSFGILFPGLITARMIFLPER